LEWFIKTHCITIVNLFHRQASKLGEMSNDSKT